MSRHRLENRRPCERIAFEYGGHQCAVTVGLRLPQLEVAEIFIHAAKPGSAIEAEARDGGIAVSLALQFGASLDDVRHSLTKDDSGRPASILGAALEALRIVDDARAPA